MGSDRELLVEKMKRLLDKFHIETDCGKDGIHWAECEAARYEVEFNDSEYEPAWFDKELDKERYKP